MTEYLKRLALKDDWLLLLHACNLAENKAGIAALLKEIAKDE